MAIPAFLLGRHITTVQVQVLTVNEATGGLSSAGSGATALANLVTSSGTLSSGLTFTVGVLNSIRLTAQKEMDNFAPTNRSVEDNRPTVIGYTIEVEEILRQGSGNWLLANLWFTGTSKYCEIKFARGGNMWDDTYLMTAFEFDVVEGKNVARATFESVDAGGGTYTAADR
jgi:hypothetical protein